MPNGAFHSTRQSRADPSLSTQLSHPGHRGNMEIRKGSGFSMAPQPTGHDASLRASQEPVFAEGATQWQIRQPFMTVVGPRTHHPDGSGLLPS